MLTGGLISEASSEFHKIEGHLIIGRSPDVDLQIADTSVSRRHAMIRQQVDGFWFFDLGSFNGSYLNGRRVTTAAKLNPDDRLEIVGHVFRFQQHHSAGTPDELFQKAFEASTMAKVISGRAILLVSDIQGFTRISERLGPDQLAPIIGSWYAQTEAIISQFGATLDKFIGDCVLAYWLDTCIENRVRAIHAAGAMQQSCMQTYEKHKEVLEAADLHFISGAALHIGPVAYGGMSSQEFTLVGDAVNVAFRVESMTRVFGEPVLATRDFLKGWAKGPDYCRPLGTQEVKGREDPIEVLSVDKLPTLYEI